MNKQSKAFGGCAALLMLFATAVISYNQAMSELDNLVL